VNKKQQKNDSTLKLLSQTALVKRLAALLENAQQEHKLIAVVMISLHHLKTINSEFGHKSGDELIEAVGKRLTNLPIKYDVVAKLYGTNFILVLEDLENKSQVEEVVSKIIHVLHQPIVISNQQHIPSATAGISLYPDNAVTAEKLIDKAFQAAHMAHLSGMQPYVFYAYEISSSSQANRILENDLLLALQQKEFRLLFQPQINTKTNEIEGVEALVRWFNSRLGEISPVFFVPIAENSGLINVIGEWVIDKACSRIESWLKQGVIDDNFFISINVSPVQLENNQLCDYILSVLSKYDVPSKMIQIELTETGLMQNLKSSIKQLEMMRESGIKIAVDDFGTGYSSLTHLSNLPVDIVKLDRSFISSINDPTTQMVVKSVIDLAHQLELQVTAEGVETEEQLKILNEFNCDLIQGFYYSMPLNEEQILRKINLKGKGGKS